MNRTLDILITPSRFWRRRGATEDVPLPAPFRVKLNPAVSHLWAGVVVEPGHAFDGRSIYLSQRNSVWTGEVDIEISPRSQEDFRSGPALIQSRPFKPPLGGAAAKGVGSESLAPHDRLLAYWAGLDYPRVVTHGETEIISLETHYGVSLPTDFRAYLLHACSTLDDGGGLDEWSAWWGLERIRSLMEECGREPPGPALALDPDRTLLFVDHMMWCWAWGICCDGGPNRGRVVIVGDRDRWVADSFTEFVDRYLGDQQSLY